VRVGGRKEKPRNWVNKKAKKQKGKNKVLLGTYFVMSPGTGTFTKVSGTSFSFLFQY
jgi:hypothetical protein